MPLRMNHDGTLDMVDIHGYVHQVSAEVHHEALGLAWGLFLGAVFLNLLFYKGRIQIKYLKIKSVEIFLKGYDHVYSMIFSQGKLCWLVLVC